MTWYLIFKQTQSSQCCILAHIHLLLFPFLLHKEWFVTNKPVAKQERQLLLYSILFETFHESSIFKWNSGHHTVPLEQKNALSCLCSSFVWFARSFWRLAITTWMETHSTRLVGFSFSRRFCQSLSWIVKSLYKEECPWLSIHVEFFGITLSSINFYISILYSFVHSTNICWANDISLKLG